MARRSIFLLVAVLLTAPASAIAREATLDAVLTARARAAGGSSRVILTTVGGVRAEPIIVAAAGIPGRVLAGVGQVATVPDAALLELASRPEVLAISLDRSVTGTVERTGETAGAEWIAPNLGFDGSGVGVAIIDSGVANWHDDLGTRTVVHFADFVSDLVAPHDDYGHGTHVAGIIAGNGYDSGGARRGVAPGAQLIVLKVLDEAGDGHISNVIAAIDYAIAHQRQFNIRVINLSVSAGVHESYTTDPLTLAAKRAVEAGIVVVTAAGNLGRSAKGNVQYGGITSPGNAPWVLTVGATDDHKTASRIDDTVAAFSSRGPTHIDHEMKPDIVAPGVAVESLADASSTIYQENPQSRLAGTVDTVAAPYISLTGTSMASPVVAGTVALMLEANAGLTPNLVKAILQYTAERRPRYEITAQGAGFLNARGAVQLATELAGGAISPADPTRWSRHILWGSQRISGGLITMDGNAWQTAVIWGAPTTPGGERIVWGTLANTSAPWTLEEDGHRLDETLDEAAWVRERPLEGGAQVRAAAIRVESALEPRGADALLSQPRRRALPRNGGSD
jgi:subtilisin family serine protease